MSSDLGGAFLRVGLIGFGGAGIAHRSYYSRVPGCLVTRVFDVKAPAFERARVMAPECEVFDRIDDFLSGVDAVSVCSPDDTHAEYIVAALARGVHVLVEKPLSSSIDGLRAIIEAQSRSRAVVAVLHQMRFVPLFERMKEVLGRGTLGDVAYLEGYYVHDLTQRAFAYDDWRATSDATPLVYAGCHFVDLLRWFTDEEPVEVHATAGHRAFPRYPESDLNVAVYRFPSGAVGKVLVSIGTPGPQDHSVRVYGSKGMIDNAALFDAAHAWRQTLHRPMLVQSELLGAQSWPGAVRAVLRQLRRHTVPWMTAWLFEALRRLASADELEYVLRHFPVRLYEHRLACLRAVHNFVAAVHGAATPRVGVVDSARTVLACLAGVESYRSGASVKIRRLEEVL